MNVVASFPGSPGMKKIKIKKIPPAQLQCLRSGAWEHGNEAMDVWGARARLGERKRLK